ncbi:DoxX family protein [Falsirhodobacter sp. 20TX0035]|uniref:DoxX family protein n=1 Tax=Falsirhodobacter sp. 20TX0035 TaxID=3022019 RepID=UPI00232CE7E0|nr:DoxX family protein [Falsirhodobacter sp. 20TX0035]MDB6453816.1 DoxX family protein [Falsirhodobacter sp. 20TX0035]
MENLSRYQPAMLSVLRIAAGLLILSYGTMKILHFPVGMQPPVGSMAWFAGCIELICGALVLVGLFTRSAAFLLSGLMAFAFFIAHFPKGLFPALNGGSLAMILCFVFLYLAVAGAGPFSVDAKRRKA